MGIHLCVGILHWLLDNFHDWVMAVMVGLMLGSTRVLWAWPSGTNSTTLGAPSDDVAFPILITVLGVVLVIGVDQLGRRFATHNPDKVAHSIPS